MQILGVLQKRFRGGGWSPGRSHSANERGLTLVPSAGASATKSLKILHNVARKTGVSKRTYLASFYELPTLRRARERSERAHFSRWHYLKYCTQILQYGLKYTQRALPLAKPQPTVANDLLAATTAPLVWAKPKRDAMNEEELRIMAASFYSR